MKKVLTLCLVCSEGKMLLGMKKRGFGMGKWNGFGGKVEPGESVEEAARRELFEESGITAKDLVKIGINEFEFKGDPVVLEVHVFKTTEFSGEPSESEEMDPKWFPIDEIPYNKMWVDDIYWMPLFLQGKNFKGRYYFENPQKILEYAVKEVDEL